MDAAKQRTLGLVYIALGLAVIVLAVLLFGLTTASGALDWVSIITAVAGLVLAVTGAYNMYRNKGTGSAQSGPRPHTAS